MADRPLDPADYPGVDPDLLVPGSLVFRRRRVLSDPTPPSGARSRSD